MAETQRKAQADQARLAFDGQKLQADIAKHADDNKTKVEIENAKITGQAISDQGAQQTDMQKHLITAAMQPPAAPAAQPQGAPNGNQ